MKRFFSTIAICMVYMHVFCQDTVRVGNEIPYSDNMLSGCSKFKGVKYQQ